ncbi:MAG TPA: type II toxin-antitoxin system VapB family antitoxin [Dongiaceae bacterium]|nr:type II toxin-antitoxin system VapB family antitoxin [Dongiaceae bacterium]
MKDELHIRDAEAVQLVRSLARQTGKTIDEVVLDALRQYRPAGRGQAQRKEVEVWRRLLRIDRKGAMKRSETPVEALYDDDTGLPA